MGFEFLDLSPPLRRLMLEELDLDLSGRGRYVEAPRLTERGRADFLLLIRIALGERDPAWLTAELGRHARLHETELRPGRDGAPLRCRVPHNAAELLAEGEFNRYYVRAVCRWALDLGFGQVEVYRAKAVKEARPASEQRIGSRIDARALLADLRLHSSEDEPDLGVPSGPGSGLSVRLPRAPGQPGSPTRDQLPR